VLRQELGLGEDVFDAATTKKYEGLLEKKWTSIVRLQKKACPLNLGCPALTRRLV
jgi:platelet-activating factor acetylhydrolase IB subunit alpha